MRIVKKYQDVYYFYIFSSRSVKGLPESPNSDHVCPNCKRRLPSWNRRSTIAHPGLKNLPKTANTQNIHETESTVQRSLGNVADDNLCTSDNVGLNQPGGRELKTVNTDVNDDTKEDYTGVGEMNGQVLPGMVTTNNCQGHQLNQSQDTNEISPEKSPLKVEPSELRELNTSFCQCTKRLQTEELEDCNQRLLPNTANPLHIIDGDNHRYFIGIIDVFTQFKFQKKMEYLYKCVRYPTRSFSTVSPQQYAQRFREFCSAKSE